MHQTCSVRSGQLPVHVPPPVMPQRSQAASYIPVVDFPIHPTVSPVLAAFGLSLSARLPSATFQLPRDRGVCYRYVKSEGWWASVGLSPGGSAGAPDRG